MKLKRFIAMTIISTTIVASTITTAYAGELKCSDLTVESSNNFELEWVKSYYNNKYPTTEGYDILSYSYDKDNKVVVVNVREKDMEDNTCVTYAGLYDETNLTITNLKWVRAHFSMKYPSSQGYVIHRYSYDNKTNKAKVELSNIENMDLIVDEIKCDVVSNGKAYVVAI